jgi:transposase
MSKKPVTNKAEAEKVVKDIRRATRKIHSAEEKVRIDASPITGDYDAEELAIWCLRSGPGTYQEKR